MKLNKLNQLLEDDQVTKGKWGITPNREVQYRAEHTKPGGQVRI